MGSAASSISTSLSTTATSADGTVPGEPVQAFTPEALQNPEFQTFMKEVNTMLQRMSALRALHVKEPLNPEIAKMEVDLEEFGVRSERMALLDSGATHPFKSTSPEEDERSRMVEVTLADGNSVTLRQNPAGTLMPARGSDLAKGGATTTIVPLGTLVQELGCSISWDRRGLRVRHPEHGSKGVGAHRGD